MKNTPFFLRLSLSQQQSLLQGLLLLILLLPLAAAGWWWWGKHHAWQENLQRQEAVYARLAGMQAQQAEIAQALQQASQHADLYLYPAEGEPEATANAALQQLRRALDQVGVQVSSSQIKVDAEDSDSPQHYQRVQLLLQLDGKWSDIQLALAALRDIRPLLWVDRVQISLKTRLQNANTQVEQDLSAGLTVSLFKAKGQP